jgi:hypothetical protein
MSSETANRGGGGKEIPRIASWRVTSLLAIGEGENEESDRFLLHDGN